MDVVNQLLQGAIAFGFGVVALFFLRFWRDGRDRFFLLFSLSFFIEGINRVDRALAPHPNEGSPTNYLVRLAALLLILVAIMDKNGMFSRRR